MWRFLTLILAGGLAFAAEPRTLRLDYIHAGTAAEEQFALDGMALEGPWPGRLDRLIDDTNLGKYFFEVADLKSGRTLYSRGFASIYGEWELTAEAKSLRRAFSESLRFPAPEARARVILKKRDAKNQWREVWSVTVDPADPAIDRSLPPAAYKPWAVMKNGEPGQKADVLLLGDGYTRAQMEKWHARRAPDGGAVVRRASVQAEAQRFQRVGHRHAVGANWHLAPVGRGVSPFAVRRGLRRLRLGALHSGL